MIINIYDIFNKNNIPIRQDGGELRPVSDVQLVKDGHTPGRVPLVARRTLQVLSANEGVAVHVQHPAHRLVQAGRRVAVTLGQLMAVRPDTAVVPGARPAPIPP